jgi:hypothetical protein
VRSKSRAAVPHVLQGRGSRIQVVEDSEAAHTGIDAYF